MFDIITFGSATRDNFLKLKKENHQIIESNKFVTDKGLCFSLGSKIAIENLVISTGGGGTNTAATFALQGLKTAYMGKLGRDKRGEAVIEDLKKLGIDTSFIKKDNRLSTSYSVIISSGPGRATILVYRGACSFLTKQEIPFRKLKARWFYLAPLNGKLIESFGSLVDYAKQNKIKVMANLGKEQINLAKTRLKPILAEINILNLNQEEASLLTGIPFKQEEKLFSKLDKMIEGIAIMTKGKDGVVVSDGKYMWSASSLSVPLIDVTGAGDAFGSGFLSGMIKTNDISFAIKLGTANSASCIQEIGAKNGLLKGTRTKYLRQIKVKKVKL